MMEGFFVSFLKMKLNNLQASKRFGAFFMSLKLYLTSKMPFYTYILESEETGKLYIGQTGDVAKRLVRHNSGQSRYTKGKGPWELLYSVAFETRTEAILMERKLKGFKNPAKVKMWIDKHSQKE
ncbi:GIY-YIG nuclease family protein [uncultured Draconibacterium sp.]|uniref:GIY-YIG nuclease family protein n=2 Tax=uncultured Draconibacterium sp. TaxID=1573823 RepID=UPI003216DA5E